MHFKQKNTTFVKFNFCTYKWTFRTMMPSVDIGFRKDYWCHKTNPLKLSLTSLEVWALSLDWQRRLETLWKSNGIRSLNVLLFFFFFCGYKGTHTKTVTFFTLKLFASISYIVCFYNVVWFQATIRQACSPPRYLSLQLRSIMKNISVIHSKALCSKNI